MIAATRYPAFSRNFDDEQDYADAAVSAARKANPLPSGLSLAPILRWKRHERQRQDRSSSSVRRGGAFETLRPTFQHFLARHPMTMYDGFA